MADISDLQADSSVKIVGSDAAGMEQTLVQSTTAGGIHANLRTAAGAELLVSTEATLNSVKNLLTDQTNGATGAIIAADTTTVTTVGANGQPIYIGSATAGSSTSFLLANLTVQAISGVFRVSGTWVGTIQLEGSYDNATYHRIPMVQENGQPIFSTSGNGLFTANVAGFLRYRWRGTAFTSGTATIDLRASNGSTALSILNFPSNFALDSTQTNGSAKVIVRGGAKGTTLAADVTSIPVDANTQAMHVFVSGTPGFNMTQVGTQTYALGQTTMAASMPVTISSNQTVLPVIMKAADLAVSTTALVGVALTATLPAAGVGLFHYITAIRITAYSTMARVGTATPLVVTTSNIPGATAWTFSTAAAIGTVDDKIFETSVSLKSSASNVATTIVCPATASVVWRINVNYSTGT